MAADNEFNPVLGIDLGTTFSAIARWDGRGPRHYQHAGKDDLRSLVHVNPQTKEILIGQVAYTRGLLDPGNMVLGVKRMMDDSSRKIAVGGQEFTPIEISSFILKRLYGDVAEIFPKGLFRSRGTVVTVPYYFKAHQCDNTRRATELAEIDCIGLIQEPIAASLAYAWQLVQEKPEQELKEMILVFDLGGGTFDLTLFELEQRQDRLVFEVLATGGDDRLGGMDFDNCLVQLLLDKSKIKLDGFSELEQRKARQRLLLAAEDAKITLGATEHTDVAIGDVIPGRHIDTSVSRAEFIESIAPYFEKIKSIIENLWHTATKKPSDVKRVILVGGSSRIPHIKSLLTESIGEDKIYRNINPSLCVAEGAAMYAAYLDDREVFGREIEIRTRTCHPLGVENEGGVFFALISANRKTPCEQHQVFTTTADNMTSLDITVYQGPARLVKDNTHIGTINITGLPPKPRGELDIHVTFKVNEEQVLSVKVQVADIVRDVPFTFT